MVPPELDISSLMVEERLDLIERLWDSLAPVVDSMAIPEWQRVELDRRLDELDREGSAGIPWEEALEQIRRRTHRAAP
jgi:putative addiction module component (TIGR02574 family)